MPRPFKLDRPQKVGIVLPTSTLAEVRLLLHDPARGRAKYGALSSLIDQLLSAWVEQTKLKLQQVKDLTDGTDTAATPGDAHPEYLGEFDLAGVTTRPAEPVE